MQSHQRTEAASVNYDSCSNEGVAKQKFSLNRTVAVHVHNNLCTFLSCPLHATTRND